MSDDSSQAPPAPRRWIHVDFATGEGRDQLADAEAVSAVGVGDVELSILGSAPHLVELAVTGDFSDEGLASLKDLTHLEHLFICSPNIDGSGLGHLAGRCPLRVLGLRDTGLTQKGVRRCTTAFPDLVALHIAGPTIGIDHVVAVRPLTSLEVVTIIGGGDFLGGADCKLDRASAVEFVRGCPNLKFYGAWWAHGMSMMADRSIIAMSEARPGCTINGIWYDPSLFDDNAEPDERRAAVARDDAEGPIDSDTSDEFTAIIEASHIGSPSETDDVSYASVLSTDDFENLLESSEVLVVKCWSSSPDLSRRAIIELARELEVMDQVAQALSGRAVVGTVDLHHESELGPIFGERYHAGIGTLLVFRRGVLVGRFASRGPSTIVALLEPVFEPRPGPGGWADSEALPHLPG